MSELKQIDVERVDGVDAPATKKKFLILKAEEPDELRQNLLMLREKIDRALSELAKSEDLTLSQEAADALNEVAKALELEYVFEAKKPKEEYGYPPEEYGYPPEEGKKKPAKKSEDSDQSSIEELINKKFDELLQALKPQEQPVAKSRQVPGQDSLGGRPRKLGEGLFTDVIFGS